METSRILLKVKRIIDLHINHAIDNYIQFQKRMLLAKKLRYESIVVKGDSMSVLKEFEEIEYVD